jgi:hypothetical protein
MNMTRSEVLSKADSYVNGDREQDYGSPESNFQTIADLWAVYLQGCGVTIDFLEPHDVAAMLALLKIARISSGHAKADNWIDLAGYAACGGEIQSVADIPTTDKPVEPWGEEDDERQDQLLCDVGRCNSSCVFKKKANSDELGTCEDWCKLHPAEARNMMDVLECFPIWNSKMEGRK